MRQADLSERYFADIRMGRKPLTEKTYNKICAAISCLDRESETLYSASRADDKKQTLAVKYLTIQTRENPIVVQYRMLLSFVCWIEKASIRQILASDPRRRATADDAWMEAARIRRITIYIACVHLGLRQADVARAAGMSRAAVCGALKDVEDLRGDPHVQTVIGAFEEAFS